MKVSSIATSIIASTWAHQVAARVSSIRALTYDADKCLEAQKAAAELIESAEIGCGSAASNPSWTNGDVMPNPTCLLLLCTAKRSGDVLLAANCDQPDTLLTNEPEPGWGLRGMCELVPGFLPPLGPVARPDDAEFDFETARAGGSIEIDILDNDDITYGNPITIEIVSQPANENSLCEIDDHNHLVFSPSNDIDDGDQECVYELCYTERYAEQCAQATVTITVASAPTPAPSPAPTIGCQLGLKITPQVFPPADFDARAKCEKRPSVLALKFNGGNCDQTDNAQNDDTCEDVGDGPTPEGRKYVVINNGDDYFEGPVGVGEVIFLDSVGGNVAPNPGANAPIADMHKSGDGSKSNFPSNLELLVYSDMSKETLLQKVEFHSSCSRTLQLSDKYGSFQVSAYRNDVQETVSIWQNFAQDWKISNFGTDTVTLTSASLEFAQPPRTPDGLVGVEIQADNVHLVTVNTALDTTVDSTEYTANVTGKNTANDAVCSADATSREPSRK